MRLQRIRAEEHLSEVSRILQNAWAPPSLRYGPADIGWLFRGPGWGQPYALMATEDDGEPIGFIGALARRVRFRGQTREVYLDSFLSVVPGPGRGPVATALIRREGKDIGAEGRPLITFTQPDSPGEMMLKGFDSVGLVRRGPVHRCHVQGGLPLRLADGLWPVREATAAHWGTVLELAARCDDATIIRDCPDRPQLEHELTDPRGRCIAIVEGPCGRPVAAGIVFRTETRAPKGPESAATVGTLYMPKPAPEILRSLVAFAAARWAGTVSSAVVIVPNAVGLDAELLRAVGLRATPASWVGWSLAPDPSDPLLDAQGMGVEIV
jgi:hypothetical protein